MMKRYLIVADLETSAPRKSSKNERRDDDGKYDKTRLPPFTSRSR
jgi:hypothetical protein